MLRDIYFNGTRLRNVTLRELSGVFWNLPSLGIENHIHFLAASSIVAAADSQELNEIFGTGVSICDSGPLGAILRSADSEFRNIRGSDFLREIIRLDDGSKRHFFIVPNITIYNSLVFYAKSINPSFQIAGKIIPHFASSFENEYPEWKCEILESNAEFVWVGIGSPKQDYVAHHLNKATGRTCIAVGAALEFVSGAKKEAPKVIQALYLEWLFRLLSDPGRLLFRYTIGNIKFVYEVRRYFFNRSRFHF